MIIIEKSAKLSKSSQFFFGWGGGGGWNNINFLSSVGKSLILHIILTFQYSFQVTLEPRFTSATVLPAAVQAAAIPGQANMVEIMDPRGTTFEDEGSA